MARMVSKSIQTCVIRLDNKDIDFASILNSSLLEGKKESAYGKTIQLKYLEDKGSYITGIMVTTKSEGIPPKHKTSTDQYCCIDLDSDEGLAYANVFLYDKETKILMYEFNKNGVYLPKFCNYVTRFTFDTEEFGSFNFIPEPLLNIQAYNRMINMKYYKSVEIQIAQPDELIKDFKNKNDSLKNVLKAGKEIDANYLTVKFDVRQKRKEGLINNVVQRITNTLMNLSIEEGDEDLVKKIEITGFSDDPEDPDSKNKNIVDLILDKFKCNMKIEEKRVLQDLQIGERKTAIHDLYIKHKSEFLKIVSVQNKHKLN